MPKETKYCNLEYDLSNPQVLLAWQRNHMSNERTLLAWSRTGLSLLVFSFVIERFDFFLKEIQNASIVDVLKRKPCIRSGSASEPSALEYLSWPWASPGTCTYARS
jgi:hypothetical protein